MSVPKPEMIRILRTRGFRSLKVKGGGTKPLEQCPEDQIIAVYNSGKHGPAHVAKGQLEFQF